MIEVTDVRKQYGKHESSFVALQDVSFEIADGATVSVVGKSGSGKSTLLHILSGLDEPTAGTVVVDGTDLYAMKPSAKEAFRAGTMSFIFQAFYVEANQTVAQNVALPLEIAKISGRERSRMVQQALEAVELADKTNVLAGNLSGGQKQRLAIARAIVNNPRILFADEPTGNLDSTTGEKIMQLLFDLNKRLGCTLILVTHDHELAERCQLQITISDGKISSITKRKKETA